MSVFLQPIYTQTVGAGGVASITFNNIPQNYTDLKLEISARSNSVFSYDNIKLSLNGSAGSGSSVRLLGVNTTVQADTPINTTLFNALPVVINGNGATANTFSNTTFYIPNYSRGLFKSFYADSVTETNSATGLNGLIGMSSATWNNTAPITSLSFAVVDGSLFLQNTTITLYGITNVYDTAIPAVPTLGAVTDLGGVLSFGFTANDSGQGQTAEYYTAQDVTIMGAPAVSSVSPITFLASTGVTYNSGVRAVNALGASSNSSVTGSISTVNNYGAIATINGFGGTFTNIPQYYRHLQLRITGRAATALASAPIMLTINGQTATNYVWHQLYGNSSSALSGGLTGQNQIEVIYATGAGSSANFYGVAVIDILDYTSIIKWKTVRAVGGFDTNSSGLAGLTSGYFPSFQCISSIGVSSYAGFDANTTIALYGIGG